MGELSKTADAARKAVERSHKKEAKELTVEERISNIRKNLDAGLYVPATEVKLLLEQYDAHVVALRVANTAINEIEKERSLIVEQAAIELGERAGAAAVQAEAAAYDSESNAHKAVEELETIPS